MYRLRSSQKSAIICVSAFWPRALRSEERPEELDMSITDALPETDAESVRDLATENGRWYMKRLHVSEYLERQDIFDPQGRSVQFDPAATFQWMADNVQRAVLDIRTNPIKRRMLRDLMRGGTLPPIVVYDAHRPDHRWDVVDGLQRTHVLAEALKALIALEDGGDLERYAAAEVDRIRELGQELLSVKDFLRQPLTLQVWEDLKSEELIRLFMLLNVGQQKVSARHLLEVVDQPLRKAFEEWGIPVSTEKEEKEQPKRRGRPRKDQEDEPPTDEPGRWSFAHLLAGLTAYVSHDPQTRINTLPQDEAAPTREGLSERITELGDEICRSDFQWACNELHPLIRERYAELNSAWSTSVRQAIFFVPLMAALGRARHQAGSLMRVENHKRELLEVLKDSSDDDPLQLVTGAQSLKSLQDNIRSNIGRRKRGIAYVAWVQYFTQGQQGDYPVDWTIGEVFRD